MSPLERAWRGGRSDLRLHVLSIFSVSVAFVCMVAALEDEVGASRVRALADTLGALPAVESVETYQSWTERLASLLRAGVAASGLLAAVVLAAVVSVVASTIRLTLQRRRVEVEVLKLIGATDDYLRPPLIIQGAVPR